MHSSSGRLVKFLVAFNLVHVSWRGLIWIERRLLGLMAVALVANRVGPLGIAGRSSPTRFSSC